MFKYEWTWEGKTSKEFAYGPADPIKCRPLSGFKGDFDIEEFKEKAKDSITTTVLAEMEKKAREEGITDLRVLKVEPKAWFSTRCAYEVSLGRRVRVIYLRLHAKAKVTFESSQKLTGSPLAPALIALIKYVVVAVLLALVACWIATMITNWLKSMTTVTSKIHTIYYDEEGNITKETYEETIKPSLPGIAGVGAMGGGILIILVVIFLIFFVGIGRRK